MISPQSSAVCMAWPVGSTERTPRSCRHRLAVAMPSVWPGRRMSLRAPPVLHHQTADARSFRTRHGKCRHSSSARRRPRMPGGPLKTSSTASMRARSRWWIRLRLLVTSSPGSVAATSKAVDSSAGPSPCILLAGPESSTLRQVRARVAEWSSWECPSNYVHLCEHNTEFCLFQGQANAIL